MNLATGLMSTQAAGWQFWRIVMGVIANNQMYALA